MLLHLKWFWEALNPPAIDFYSLPSCSLPGLTPIPLLSQIPKRVGSRDSPRAAPWILCRVFHVRPSLSSTEMCSAGLRGVLCLSQSLVLVSRLPYVNLFQCLLQLIAPEYFDKLEPCLEAGELGQGFQPGVAGLHRELPENRLERSKRLHSGANSSREELSPASPRDNEV